MCWGNRAGGQVGDNGGFNNPSDRTSPSSAPTAETPTLIRVPSRLHWFPTPLCHYSRPAHWHEFDQGTCAIAGTPTVTATNATYTVWANVSGQSFSGQVWIEVGLSVPIVSYSPSLYIPSRRTPPSPPSFRATRAVKSRRGRSTARCHPVSRLEPATVAFGVRRTPSRRRPPTPCGPTTLQVPRLDHHADRQRCCAVHHVRPLVVTILATSTAMTAITLSNSGGSIVSCSVSPSSSGLSLSNTCTLSGTPTNGKFRRHVHPHGHQHRRFGHDDLLAHGAASGGTTLTISPTHRVGSANSALANIHRVVHAHGEQLRLDVGRQQHHHQPGHELRLRQRRTGAECDSSEQGELVVVYARKDSTTTTHSLAMLYRWNGTWTKPSSTAAPRHWPPSIGGH